MEETALTLAIGGERFNVALWDTPAGRELLAQLPAALTFTDFNGVEKTAPLAKPLSLAGVPAGAEPEIGDLGYYAPNQVLVLYYGKVGYWNGIVRLGRIHGDLSVIEEQHDGFDAVLERTN